MKTIRNILAALLLFLFIWANARANVVNSTSLIKATTMQVDKDQVEVYVSNDILHIDFDRIPKEKIHVEVFDITGKRIEHVWLPIKQKDHREVELSQHLKKGLYIIKVSNGKHMQAIKLQI